MSGPADLAENPLESYENAQDPIDEVDIKTEEDLGVREVDLDDLERDVVKRVGG